MTTTSADTTARGSKRGGSRPHPIVSCSECRRMKWKCDKTFPCANCEKRGLAGICPRGRMNGVKGDRDMILTLQAEVARLNAELLNAQQQQPGVSAQLPLSHEYQTGASELTASDTAPLMIDNGSIHLDHEEIKTSEDDDHGQLTLGEEPGSSKFFGKAGAPYLLHSYSGERSVTSPSTTHPKELGTESGHVDSFPFYNGPAMTLLDLRQMLPERSVAERLVKIYFEDASYFTQTVIPQTFHADFLDPAFSWLITAPRFHNQRIAAVLLVLAIGAQFDLNLPPYNQLAENYYRKARLCLALNPAGSITLVQCIHLMHRYIVHSKTRKDESEGFWTTLGMGVRCAQSLGLHRDGQNWGLEQDVVEFRRRVFWEIYTCDTMMSLTLGRPRLSGDEVIDTIFPSDTEGGSSVNFLFLRHKYHFARICGRINDLQLSLTPPAYTEILVVDQMLRQLQADLPDSLERPQGGRREAIQGLIARCLIADGYMFLHRSHFARALKDSSHGPLESPFRYSYIAELESSRAMISILREALTVDQLLISRIWIFFFHTFTAIVNFAASVIRAPESPLANAAFAQIEEGVRLFELIGGEHRAHDDLPVLYRLRDRAKVALDFHFSSRDPESASMIGLGTTLCRMKANLGDGPIAGLPTNGSMEQSWNDFDPLLVSLADMETQLAEVADIRDVGEDSLTGDADTLSWNLSHLYSDTAQMVDRHMLPTGTDFDFDAFLADLGALDKDGGETG